MAVDVFENNVCERAEAKDSAVCKDKNLPKDSNPIFGDNSVLMTLTNLLTTVVAIAAIIMIILAGLKYVTSGNNPQEVTSARERIIYAVIALVVAALAQVIVRFGIDRIVA